MAPARKKSVNKRFLNEVSPEKEVKSSGKSKQQANGKKKLSDKLGPQWKKAELERFYKAYRDNGTNWKKVAAEVRNRSVEMVEALYNMNRAYLSLPEGTASVVGLIAMMIDHYSVLEASDSERESNELPVVLRKPQKHKRPKVLLGASKEDPQHSRMVGSTDGCLSLLKRGCGRPLHAVGKRTPRFPVSYLRKKDDGENYVSPKKKRRKLEINADDNDNEHAAVLALTEALQRVDSPQMSQTPCGRTENMKSSPVQSWDRMSESSPANLCDASINENWSESGIGRGGPDLACVRDASSLAEMEGIGTVEVHRKGKKFYGNKIRVEKIGNSQSDDGGEACSGTEKEQKASTLKGKVEIEMSNAKIDETFHRSQRKRSKKPFSDDEPADLMGLQTLALVSAMEFESSSLLDDDRTTQTGDDKSSIPESASTSHHRDKTKFSRQKKKATSEVEGATSGKSKLGRYPQSSAKSVSEANKRPQSISNDMLKRKREALVAKVLDEEENTSVVKGKHSAQISSPSKQLKSSKLPDGSFSGDQKTIANDLATSTEQVPVASQVILPTRKTSRRKMDLRRAMIPKVNVLKNQISKYSISLQDGATHLKDKLSCILSSPMVRRWCTFEWFYSAVDYPWFAKREFVEYLNHVGLGHIPRLTRVEWGVIRSSLGKPRRFSERFLQEEREKLQQYRESVRKHYMELRTGLREGLPTDLARPLSVGQRVIAIHPKTRELHDGSVLTVDHDRCRVQFDRAELGVEFVKDIDCMPSNPLDNMPEAPKRQKTSVLPKELPVNGKSNIGEFTAIEKLRNAESPMNALTKQAQVEANHANLLAKATSTDIVNAQGACGQPSRVSQIQLKEYDIRALSELNCVLDKKASSALLNLRQLNTYPGNNVPAWLKPPANSCFSGMLRPQSSCVSQDSGSAVLEIVRGLRLKAHAMVDAAVQAISSMKEGEDAFSRIGEALDSMNRSHLGSESRAQMIRSQEEANTGLGLQNQLIPSTPESQVNCNVSGPQSNDSEKIETAIPSELISSCVAALLMIQTCTERQYPPSDVAQIIDSAVTSLHPCCPQNLPIYREIQMCMGRIKTQILALIPT
ncbi:PREDICTED: protein ALWAYS EARLY 2-like isoform X2 [Populus euphratica]|uniref:Protein ALWAYS EARLY 2-like isoform X2 n=1 Tax=Populus euphratica TaxID=75702 RepID=A0AAJ6UWA3_POPEU|nr:PREDICTED: protein ALWAYS EARLY 2-like isoform X2 [Populus euphratica]